MPTQAPLSPAGSMNPHLQQQQGSALPPALSAPSSQLMGELRRQQQVPAPVSQCTPSQPHF
jgi:hypothetical protein